MPYFLFRRLSLLAAVAVSFISMCLVFNARAQPIKLTPVQAELAKLEALSGGILGVSALNTANNTRIQFHAEKRLPMGCTSKVIGVSAILKKSMTDTHLLQQKITYKKEDLASWSPITSKYVSQGMTIFELCAAAITASDNTAMNLLAEKLGGPQGINAFARSIGDSTFRLDHGWPEEAQFGPADLFDSSTPAAMEKSLQRLAFGDVLTVPLREQLQTWLKSSTTGNERIRAGVPQGWIVGDKTGTGSYYGTTNDIAIIWPPNCAPIIAVIYFTHDKKEAVKEDKVVASATQILMSEFARTDKCLKLKSF